jgi:TrmH family RNA methyltransferase
MASVELTSVRSPRVTAARRLAKRSFRSRERRFLAEGPQAVREAAAVPGVLNELFVTAEAGARHPE